MLTAKEALDLTMKAREAQAREHFDRLESWIKKAASNGDTAINVDPILMTDDVVELLAEKKFSVSNNPQECCTISWDNPKVEDAFTSIAIDAMRS